MQTKINGLANLLQGLSETEIDAAVQLLQTLQTQRKSGGESGERATLDDVLTGGAATHEPNPALPVHDDDALVERADLHEDASTAAHNDNDDDVPLSELCAMEPNSPDMPASQPCTRRRTRKLAAEAAVPDAGDGSARPPCGSQRRQRGGAAVKTATTPLVMHSLTSFGFQACPVTSTAPEQNYLFPPFVQDRRVVPRALQFWLHEPSDENATQAAPPPAPPPCDVEESSLMHPPFCVVEDSVSASHGVTSTATLDELIEASNVADDEPGRRDALRERMHFSVGSLHTTLPAPYTGFDREVVFCGFYAVGYDPFQARPPYFGSYNHLQESHLNETELRHLGRFAAATAMPRLSTLDYDYDSGDDWDVMEGDDGIALSDSDTVDSDPGPDDDSLSSSERDFINDDDDEDDSDCELQRRMLEARERRLTRLRGKDRLVPCFSGPFVGIAPDEHPLRGYDALERLAPMDDAFFSSTIDAELAAVGFGARTGTAEADAEESEGQRERRMIDAALKGRRDMTEEEIQTMHELIAASNRVPTKILIEVLRQRHLCIGVPRAEVERTVRRFYERKHGFLLRRPQPWEVTDERLFARLMRREGDAEDGVCGTPAVLSANATRPDAESADEEGTDTVVGDGGTHKRQRSGEVDALPIHVANGCGDEADAT